MDFTFDNFNNYCKRINFCFLQIRLKGPDIFIEIFESFPWLKDWYCEIAVLLIPVVLFLFVVKVLLRNNKKESEYE